MFFLGRGPQLSPGSTGTEDRIIMFRDGAIVRVDRVEPIFRKSHGEHVEALRGIRDEGELDRPGPSMFKETCVVEGPRPHIFTVLVAPDHREGIPLKSLDGRVDGR